MNNSQHNTYSLRVVRAIPLALLLLMVAGMLHASPGTDAYAAGDLERAGLLLADEVAQDNDPQKRKLLGIIAMSENDFKKAYGAFEALADDQPDDADTQYWLGASAGSLAANVSLFRAAGYARKARGAFERAIELDDQHVAAHQGLISYYLQAPGFLGGDKDAALALAQDMVAFAPVDGRLLLASIYSETNQPERARTMLTELADAHPDDPRALLRLGFYYQGEEDYQQAHEAFLQASKTRSDDEDATLARLGALYQVGRTAVFSEQNVSDGIAALTEYTDQTDIAATLPDINWALFRLGQLHRLAGDMNAASEVFARARTQTDDDNLLREIRKLTSGD